MKPFHALALLSLAVSSARAASVLVTNNGTATNNTTGTSLALPSGTGTDWGYFSQTGTPDPASPSFNATNTSSTGGRSFTVTTLGGGNVRGPGTPATGSAEAFYDFTNGTTPTTGTDVRPTGVFNSQLGNGGVTAGAGLSMVLSGFTGPSVIQLWTFGFQATGQFTVLLNGDSQYTTSVVSTSVVSGKPANVFTIEVNPDVIGDSIELRYVMTGTTDTANSHVGFQAVTVSPVPEPSSLALLAAAGTVSGFRRRRRNA